MTTDRRNGSQIHNEPKRPVRIEVAKAGDLAYEFSNGVLSYEMKDGRKASFPNSMLRVWRKDGGQWKVAALFSQPHYEEPSAKK